MKSVACRRGKGDVQRMNVLEMEEISQGNWAGHSLPLHPCLSRKDEVQPLALFLTPLWLLIMDKTRVTLCSWAHK